MQIKTAGLDELISGDEIRFLIETHDGSGCPTDPYQIVDVKIYFIAREFTDPNASEYQVEFFNPDLEAEYRDAKLSACIKSKGVVKAASTSSLILSGLQTVDGIELSEGDRVLVKSQVNESENGIYVVSEDSWSRSLDADSPKNIMPGMYVFVENGIVNSATGWTLEASFPLVLGSSSLKFLLFANNWTPASPDQIGKEQSSRRLEELKIQMEASKTKSPFFYKDAVTIKKFGGDFDSSGEFFPAWLNPDNIAPELKSKVMSDNIVRRVEDEYGYVPGRFFLDWSSEGAREGDYFVCWTWRPTMSNETLSSHQMFYLSGNSDGTSSIPTHRVRPDKYEILLDRYTPEMFKTRISDADISPEVLSEFNKSVAKGFMFLENQANAVIDLLDANSIQEQLLPLLSNMFNLKVKSSDPTLWRRQIKKAIPNFKKKGSISGLREAMKDAGMKLVRLARMWQVVPRYTNQQHFVYSGSNEFELSMEPILDRNFSLWRRDADEGSSWVLLGGGESSSSSSGHWSESFVEITGSTMNWIGPDLRAGDAVRVMYAFRSIPAGEQAKEDYIRSLPLMDDRDERDQEYPPKNWNVHLIEEDDDNFGVLIPVRHPFSDPIVWGRIRTEFPYSENIYNMEEYNGSRRDSLNPCDIDKSFLDRCGQCASGKFNMDLEVERLSDESLKEVKQIVEEYMPFHAVPNSFNFWGSMNEFIRHNEERIEALVSFSREDAMLAGEAQNIFSRNVYDSDMDDVRRGLLASFEMVNSPSTGNNNWSGLLRNTRTLLLSNITLDESDAFSDSGHPIKHGFKGTSPNFDSLNVDTNYIAPDPFDSSNLLEVLGSSPYRYSLSSIDRSIGVVSGDVNSSLIGPVLEYRLSNKIADLNVDIAQYEEIIFSDEDVDFTMLGIVSQHDVDLGLVSGVVWRLIFGGKEYLVNNILPDGTLLLSELSAAVPAAGWKLVAGSYTKKEGTGGQKVETGYGLISINSPSSFLTREKLKVGDYVYMDWSSTLRTYRVRAFQKDTNNFYISDYEEGDVGSQDIKVYRRIMDKKIGQFGYDSPIIVASDNLQTALGISNAVGYDESNVDAAKMAENHILFIDGEYYTISEVDGQTARLSGPQVLSDTTGSSVTFNVLRFAKENLTLHKRQNPPYDEALESQEFDKIDRSGGSIISGSEGANTVGVLSSMLNSSEPLDVLSHDEKIEYQIEYKEERK